MRNNEKTMVLKKAKRVFAMFAVIVLICSTPALSVHAGGLLIATRQEGINVYVTISDDTGTLRLAQEETYVIDVDGDGVISVNDALFCAHEANYEGGAEAGYGSAATDFGMSLTKLWGVENGGSYGYYLNQESASSLLDPVAEESYLTAYCYTDLTTWSDQFVYFDAYSIAAKEGATVELKLSGAGFDAGWNPVVVPVAGAELTLNGEPTGVFTDAEGKATLTGITAGIISAVSESTVIVPPVCTVTVQDDVPQTGDSSRTVVFAVLLGAAVLLIGTGAGKAYKKSLIK